MENIVKAKLAYLKNILKNRERPIRIMEVCGTHTVALFKTGLRDGLKDVVKLISGPGCPVCVTNDGFIDTAIALAKKDGILVTTFGDMLKVPGSNGESLADIKQNNSVKMVYSPFYAVNYAIENPETKVVFLGVGFETTIPAVALAVQKAVQEKLNNFFVLCAHKLVPPALYALLNDTVKIDGLLCPGHVSVIIGSNGYKNVVNDYHLPCVVSGFLFTEMLDAIILLAKMINEETPGLYNAYPELVSSEGNIKAQKIIESFFEISEAGWRGLGVIKNSGYKLKEEYQAYDALKHFNLTIPYVQVKNGCLCGKILKGELEPPDCSHFAVKCTPESPLGPCMVSQEGSCAAYLRYKI